MEDVTEVQSMEDKRVRLLSEMQAALIFFNQPLAAIDAQDLILCPATAGVAEALALMEECGVNMIVVQDAEGRLAGVLTDRDIKKCAKLGRDPVTCPVTTIMSAPILSLPGQSPVFEAWQFMMRHNITHLFVADQDGRISGWISSNDIASIQKYSPAVLLLEIQHSPPRGHRDAQHPGPGFFRDHRLPPRRRAGRPLPSQALALRTSPQALLPTMTASPAISDSAAHGRATGCWMPISGSLW